MDKLEITNYTEHALGKIASSEIMTTQDVDKLVSIKNQLTHAFLTNQIFRTEPEALVSVLNDVSYPTIPSKYWQSVREQMVHFSQLIYLIIECERNAGELDLKKAKIELLTDSKIDKAKKRILFAGIKQMEFNLTESKRVASDRVREIMMWETIKDECMKKEKFDINNVASEQMNALKIRFEKELAISTQVQDRDVYKHTKANLDTLNRLAKEGETI